MARPPRSEDGARNRQRSCRWATNAVLVNLTDLWLQMFGGLRKCVANYVNRLDAGLTAFMRMFANSGELD